MNGSAQKSNLGSKNKDLLDTALPLSLFEGNLDQQRKRYLDFMMVEDTIIKEMKSSEFSEEIDEYEAIKRMNEVNVKESSEEVEVVLRRVCRLMDISNDELTQKTKKPIVVKAKRLAVYTLKELSGLTNTEISRLVNVSMTTVTTTLGDDGIRDKIGNEIDRIRQSKA